MKKSIKYLSALFAAMLLLSSCTKEALLDTEGNSGSTTTLSLSFPSTRNGGSPDENTIKTLRLIVFATNSTGYETGQLVLNRKFDNQDPNAATITINNIVVPTGYLNFFLIGNEDDNDDMGLGAVRSTSDLRACRLNYDPDEELDYLIPQFPMYAEYKAVYVDKNGGLKQYGQPITINTIARTVAKLTLKLDCLYSDLGKKIELTEVYVVNAPVSPHLTPQTYTGSDADDFFICDRRTFGSGAGQVQLVTKSGDTGFNTAASGIDFYIPEHIISAANLAAENYTYISISGRFQENPSVKIRYTIPLGNGLGITRGGDTFSPGFIVNSLRSGGSSPVRPSDLTVTRNMWYTLDMNIKSLGELDGMQVFPTVKPWTEKDVDGTMNSPYINVSTVTTEVDDFTTQKIYFWTNHKDIAPEAKGRIGTSAGAEFTVDDIFDNLTGGTKANFEYNPATGLGCFELSTSRAAQNTRYLIYLTAGTLRREIAVTANNTTWSLPTVPWTTTPWVGTFHRAGEVGERVIHSLHTGEWTAEVTSGDFIVLERGTGTDPALRSAAPGSAEAFPVPGSATTVDGIGRIAFRVGMKSKLGGGDPETAPRYGTITLTHSGGTSTIYVRQGEAADVVGQGTNVQWSPYNLEPKDRNYIVNPTDFQFTEYPTQAGGLKQFDSKTTMWSPVTITTPSSWSRNTDDNMNDLCSRVGNYKIPTGGNSNTSGDMGSLFTGTNATSATHVFGYYADGYFDRRAITVSANNYNASTVSTNTVSAGYVGYLFVNTTTYSHLFIPAAGLRNGDNGMQLFTGNFGYYWSSTSAGAGSIYSLFFGPKVANQPTSNTFGRYSLRCIKAPDPYIGEKGFAAPRIYVDPNGGDPKLMLTMSHMNYGTFFQFGSVISWSRNGTSPTSDFNPTVSPGYGSGWGNIGWRTSTSSPMSDTYVTDVAMASQVTSMKTGGYGDPCRLVGFTLSEIKGALHNGTVLDNNKWRLPTSDGQYDTYSNAAFAGVKPSSTWPGVATGGMATVDNKKGIWFPVGATAVNGTFLPAAGWRDFIGERKLYGFEGKYWSSTQLSGSNKSVHLYFGSGGSGETSLSEFSHANAYSVRCVPQTP